MSTLVRLACVVSLFAPIAAAAAGTSIADHGAIADGRTLNSAAIQAAVDACARSGGGTVLVPAGVWLTGSVQLKSHVTLQLENGAVLRGSPKLADYPPNGFKHLELGETRSLLWAIDQEDVAVCGDGLIELADRPFFAWDQLRTGLPPAKDAQLQDWQRKQCVVTALDRPTQPLFFHHCRRVRFEGVTITHSPCWTLVFSGCDGVQVHGIRIDNDLQVPNNDGIHFTGTSNIIVSDCSIRGGDDAIAVSAITDPASPCENITITNCNLSSRSAAIRFGYRAAKVRNVSVSNLVIRDSQRGIFLNAGDDGYVENVTISNVTLDTHLFAGAWWGKGEPLVICAADSKSAHIRGVTISHVRGSAENSVVIVGDHRNVSDVTLEDWTIAYRYSLNSPLYGQEIDIAPAAPRPSALTPDRLPWLYAESVNGLHVRNVRFEPAAGSRATLALDPVLHDVSP
jgi:polygalacturonase